MATTHPAIQSTSSDTTQPQDHDVAGIARVADQISAQNLAQSNAIIGQSRLARSSSSTSQAQAPQAQPKPTPPAPPPRTRRPAAPAVQPAPQAQPTQQAQPAQAAPAQQAQPAQAAPAQLDPYGIKQMKVPQKGTKPSDAHGEGEENKTPELVQQGAEAFGAGGEAIEQTGLYIGHRAEQTEDEAKEEQDEEREKDEARAEDRAHTAAALGATASGIGAVTSGVGSIAALVGFAQNVRRFRKLKDNGDLGWLEGLELGAEAAGNLTAGVAGGFNTLSNAGKMGAEIDVAAVGSNSAEEASKAFAGVGGGIGVVSNGAQTLVSGAKIVLGVVENIRNHRGGKDTNWSEVGVESIKMLKSFLGTAESTITSINSFMQVAGKAGEFANAVPIVGAVLNITIQLLDIAIQAVHFVTSLVKLIRASVDAQEMRREGKKSTTTAEEKKLYDHVADVNTKRWKRQIVPLAASVVSVLADLVSIGGSVLNLVGTATAPAYGAGVAVMAVGYGLSGTASVAKFGAAVASPVAKLYRTQKQFGRDVAADTTGQQKTGKMAKVYRKLHLTGAYNAEKSSDKKHTQYLEDIDRLFEMISGLPATCDAQTEPQFRRVHRLVRATGVKPKLLYKEQDEQKVVRMLLDALMKRE